MRIGRWSVYDPSLLFQFSPKPTSFGDTRGHDVVRNTLNYSLNLIALQDQNSKLKSANTLLTRTTTSWNTRVNKCSSVRRIRIQPMANPLEEDDEREEEIGTKGNKKRLPIWSVVKNTSLFITLCVFLLTSVLVLDAYKFVSVRVSLGLG